MMKRALFQCASISLLALTMSCDKTTEYSDVSLDPWMKGANVMSPFFEKNIEKSTQRFTIDPTQIQNVTGSKGLVLGFDGNSLVDETGDFVVGPVDISVVEVPKKGDMIWLNKTTTSGGKLLISGGAFFVGMEHKGQPVKTAPGKIVRITLAEQPSQNMDAFVGEVSEGGVINWVLTDTNAFVPTGNGGIDSSFIVPNAYLPMGGLNWINCDFFASGDSNTVVSIFCGDNFGLNNTQFFFYFEDENTVAPAVPDLECRCFKSYESGLPMGKRIRVLGIAVYENEKYFYSSDLFNIEADHGVFAALKLSNENAIKLALDNL